MPSGHCSSNGSVGWDGLGRKKTPHGRGRSAHGPRRSAGAPAGNHACGGHLPSLAYDQPGGHPGGPPPRRQASAPTKVRARPTASWRRLGVARRLPRHRPGHPRGRRAEGARGTPPAGRSPARQLRRLRRRQRQPVGGAHAAARRRTSWSSGTPSRSAPTRGWPTSCPTGTSPGPPWSAARTAQARQALEAVAASRRPPAGDHREQRDQRPVLGVAAYGGGAHPGDRRPAALRGVGGRRPPGSFGDGMTAANDALAKALDGHPNVVPVAWTAIIAAAPGLALRRRDPSRPDRQHGPRQGVRRRGLQLLPAGPRGAGRRPAVPAPVGLPVTGRAEPSRASGPPRRRARHRRRRRRPARGSPSPGSQGRPAHATPSDPGPRRRTRRAPTPRPPSRPTRPAAPRPRPPRRAALTTDAPPEQEPTGEQPGEPVRAGPAPQRTVGRRALIVGGVGRGVVALGAAGVASGRRPGACAASAGRSGHRVSTARSPRCRRDVRLEQETSAARGQQVGFYTAVPEGYGDGRACPVCLILHGATATTARYEAFGFGQFLTAAVQSGVPPFVLAGADGGRTFWAGNGATDDPQLMLHEEIPAWCDERGFDTSRMAAYGWSMGGHGTLLAAERQPRLAAGGRGPEPGGRHPATRSSPGRGPWRARGPASGAGPPTRSTRPCSSWWPSCPAGRRSRRSPRGAHPRLLEPRHPGRVRLRRPRPGLSRTGARGAYCRPATEPSRLPAWEPRWATSPRTSRRPRSPASPSRRSAPTSAPRRTQRTTAW